MLCVFQIVFPGALVPEIVKAFLQNIRNTSQTPCSRQRDMRLRITDANLEPDFEVESGTGVSGGVEEAEGDAAIDAAAEEDGDTKRLLGNGT